MKDNVKNIIAIMFVFFFLALISLVIIYSYMEELKGESQENIAFNYLLGKSSIFTGLIGLIIGYYFGRK